MKFVVWKQSHFTSTVPVTQTTKSCMHLHLTMISEQATSAIIMYASLSLSMRKRMMMLPPARERMMIPPSMWWFHHWRRSWWSFYRRNYAWTWRLTMIGKQATLTHRMTLLLSMPKRMRLQLLMPKRMMLPLSTSTRRRRNGWYFHYRRRSTGGAETDDASTCDA